MRADDFEIWPPCEVFYIHSMLFNTTSAMMSIRRLKEIFQAEERNHPINESINNEILDNLQNVILQGGAISRYFWPPPNRDEQQRRRHEARADFLRKALGMSDESPLKSRNLRNAIEHFDERLDKYLEVLPVGYIFPQYVGPEFQKGEPPPHIFRAYYTDTDMFQLLRDQYKIMPMADEIDRVHRRLEYCLENGGRLLPLDDA